MIYLHELKSGWVCTEMRIGSYVLSLEWFEGLREARKVFPVMEVRGDK